MAESFDPYHRWLGISPKDQPPNHYRLLGIDKFESDLEVIRDAALQRMAHVRTYQLGQYQAESQRMLNELAGAKACLLESGKKAAYDSWLRHADDDASGAYFASLRQEAEAGDRALGHDDVAPVDSPCNAMSRDQPECEAGDSVDDTASAVDLGCFATCSSVSQSRKGFKKPRLLHLWAASAMGAAGLLLILAIFLRSNSVPDAAVAQPETKSPGTPRQSTPSIPKPRTPNASTSRPAFPSTTRQLLQWGEKLPSLVPSKWQKRGCFAAILDAGSVSFPALGLTSYVVEMEVVVRKGDGNVSICSGEPHSLVRLSLDGPEDSRQPQVICHLFSHRAFGYHWSGKRQFPAGKRLALQMLVCDARRALLEGAKPVLTCVGAPANLDLTISAKGKIDCTIYSFRVRELTKADVAKLNWALPDYAAKPDRALIARLEAQLAIQTGECSEKAIDGHPLLVKTSGSIMRWIPPGSFQMGNTDPPPKTRKWGTERVQISKGFWIGRYELTQAEWQSVMGDNPSRFTGSSYLPVHWISWRDAVDFCQRLNRIETAAGRVPHGYEYRLPTEAEWEYACRAGSKGDYALPLGSFWSPGPDGPGPKLIGQFRPNDWGLYDMQGNVPEWCLDSWQDYVSRGVLIDRFIAGGKSTDAFVVRGGGWWSGDRECSSASRYRSLSLACDDRGMRLVLGPELRLAQ